MSEDGFASARCNGLHALISARRDEIVARTRVSAALRSSLSSDIESDETISRFLDQLSEALRGAPAWSKPMENDARAHGGRLSGLGYTVSEVVHSYGDICQAVTQLAAEVDAPIASDDFGAFNHLLDEAIANALVEYEVQQEAAILRKGTEREISLSLAFQDRLSIAIAASNALTMAAASTNGSMETLLDSSLLGLQILLERPLERRAGTGVLHRERVFLRGVIREATLGANIDAKRRGVSFFEVLPDALTVVSADRQLLVGALAKIVRHALQFTSSGGRVAVQVREGNGQVAIEVDSQSAPPTSRELEPPRAAAEGQRGEHQDLVRRLWPSMSALGAQFSLHDAPGRGHVFKLAFRTLVWRGTPEGPTEA